MFLYQRGFDEYRARSVIFKFLFGQQTANLCEVNSAIMWTRRGFGEYHAKPVIFCLEINEQTSQVCEILAALCWFQTSLPLATLLLCCVIIACCFRVAALSGSAALALSPSGIAPKLNRIQPSAICRGGQSGKVIDLLVWRCLPLGHPSAASGACAVEQISSSKRQCGKRQVSLKPALSFCTRDLTWMPRLLCPFALWWVILLQSLLDFQLQGCQAKIFMDLVSSSYWWSSWSVSLGWWKYIGPVTSAHSSKNVFSKVFVSLLFFLLFVGLESYTSWTIIALPHFPGPVHWPHGLEPLSIQK